MSYEPEIPQEANELIDWLSGIQKLADQITDIDGKISKVKDTLGVLSVAPLLNQEFYIDSDLVFAKNPDQAPNVRTMFSDPIVFTGRLVGLHYMLDYGVPIDTLAINFDRPTVVDADIERAGEFQSQIFQVPVLAINEHISLGKAA